MFDEMYEFRAGLLKDLRLDLVGPAGGPDEVIADPPITRYVAGILFPSDSGVVEAQEDVDIAEGDDEATFGDPPVALANTRYPSSMGVTFAVDTSITTGITVYVTAAMYELSGDVGAQASWSRRPLEPGVIDLDVSKPESDEQEIVSGLGLFHRIRPADDHGAVSVTLALVNRRSGSWPRDPDCFFQPEILVRGADGSDCFVERRAGGVWTDDAELQSYRLLYRHARNFAVGHGCAARWPEPIGSTHTAEVATSTVPDFPLRLADSNPSIDSASLDLSSLGGGDREATFNALEQLCNGYAAWLDERSTELDGLGDLADIGRKHLEDCEWTLTRMRRGIEVLKADHRAFQAFVLMNRAMRLQRARTTWHESGNLGDGPDMAASHRWRPFQIAFILLTLPGIVNESDRDRETADLLWFPTGGGKTEAYLGLIAFTLFHRRMRDGANGDGVAVFMRYTLRLLTIQQFERASLLISCCEAIRHEESDLGEEPFTIGLWVGRGGTPNTLEDAEKALTDVRAGKQVHEGNPVQVHRCPWCGSRLDAFDYAVEKSAKRMRVRCRNGKKSPASCPFGDGLPVILVDEELYHRRPALMIATADKFAALPWRSSTGRIFGIKTSSRPPELIIQDELHLISGPLGTLAGLYETAVDFLCSRDGIGPKVIASTATIRRADRQTQKLFARPMRQFPPPGLDARDSYFAVEAPADTKPTRQYVGVMAPGVSQTSLLVRAYGALLHGAATVPGSDEARDPYWTLVGYFNSLRVLGGARMQVQDDVNDRLTLLAGPNDRPRPIDERIELTSREPSSEIPNHLERMKTRFPDEEALDVILATNMISVGVDIDRLGLMAVMGQPQSTSEYIQSTSRVGRRHPGLVVVLYNASRSRDRSHYESFTSYHGALYRQVESTSVTPFSARARDRGLHAVLIALARLTVPGFAENNGAAHIDKHLDVIDVLKDRILARVAAVDEPSELEATGRHLDEIVALWRRRAADTSKLVFNQPFKPDHTLLREAAVGRIEDGNFPTLWSLRDVDMESNLYQV